MKKYIVSYAQNREDVILDAFFPGVEKGFYVDVGANHPEHDSVTKLFYEKGWSGINIEPNGRLFHLLQSERPNDINLQLGVSNHDDELDFREYVGVGDGLSTFSADMKQSYAKTQSTMSPFTKDFHDYKVQVTTLAKIFAKQQVQVVDFLKVDVEGYEYEVLEGNDWQKYRPEIICIEANHINKDWHPLLKNAKYQQVFYDGLNEYFVDSLRPEILERFSYRDSLIGRIIIPLSVSRELFYQESLNHKLEADRLNLQRRINEQNKYIYQIHQTLENHQRVRYQAKAFAVSIDTAILRFIYKLDMVKVVNKGIKARTLKLPDESATNQTLALIELAQTNDLENFYVAHSYVFPSFRHLFFVLVLQSYSATRMLAKAFIIAILRLIRRAKRLFK